MWCENAEILLLYLVSEVCIKLELIQSTADNNSLEIPNVKGSADINCGSQPGGEDQSSG